MKYTVEIEGLKGIPELNNFGSRSNKAAYRAINKTADRGRTKSAKNILSQIAFPASYLNPSQGRLVVAQKATEDRLEARITARKRPTSLSRFAVSPSSGKKNRVRVKVKPGKIRNMDNAFFLKLKKGNQDIGNAFNLGIAVRTKNGQLPPNSYKPLKIAPNLYLLYGPSVDQAFKDVSKTVSPELSKFLEKEYVRLMGLK